MKKIIVGISFTFIGMLSILLPIIYAMPLSLELTSWKGSGLWYILFSDSYFNLKMFLSVSTILTIYGIALSILAIKKHSE